MAKILIQEVSAARIARKQNAQAGGRVDTARQLAGGIVLSSVRHGGIVAREGDRGQVSCRSCRPAAIVAEAGRLRSYSSVSAKSLISLVGVARFEPAAPSSRTRCA